MVSESRSHPPDVAQQVSTQASARPATAITGGSASEAFDLQAYRSAITHVPGKLVLPTIAGPIGAIATFASRCLVRLAGRFDLGRFADRAGRRAKLTLTFVLIGSATVLIGLLPACASPGVLAPVTLVARAVGAAAPTVTNPSSAAPGVSPRRINAARALILALIAASVLLAIASKSLPSLMIAVTVALAIHGAGMFAPRSKPFHAHFPAELRCAGASFGIRIAAVIGGSLALTVATTLATGGDTIASTDLYMASLIAFSGLCAALMRRQSTAQAPDRAKIVREVSSTGAGLDNGGRNSGRAS